MKKINILFILLFLIVSLSAQNKKALLIGIGDYPMESGWCKIHGNNDLLIITDMLKNNGFFNENIVVISNERATKEAIGQAFDLLINNVFKDDVVYIHFSGHGQQITDLDGDEPDGFDEARIPYDAFQTFNEGIYEGENHFTDDELNSYLFRIREKIGNEGKIIVVSDACHSGDGSRGDEDEDEVLFVRGTKEKFVIPTPNRATFQHRRSVDWLYIAACKSFQANYECKGEDGLYYGSLSYIIAEDPRSFSTESYIELIGGWNKKMGILIKYPQNIDSEGRPSLSNDYLF